MEFAEEGKAQSVNSSTVLTHSRKGKVVLKDATCFLCNEPAGSEGLHEAATYDLDMRVWICALKLGNTALLAKLAPADMIALEAKYHHKCLVQLYNRARAVDRMGADKDIDAHLHGIAFTELVAYGEMG